MDFNVSQKKVGAFQDGMFVMVTMLVMMGLMKIQISEIVVSNIQSILTTYSDLKSCRFLETLLQDKAIL